MRRLVLLAVFITSLLAACGGSDSQTAADPLESTAAPLDFTATAVDGSQISGSDLGDGPLIFWFWAPW